MDNNGWVPCTEENYPELDDCMKCAVKVYDPVDEKFRYYLYYDCPLGWTTLMKRAALCKMID